MDYLPSGVSDSGLQGSYMVFDAYIHKVLPSECQSHVGYCLWLQRIMSRRAGPALMSKRKEGRPVITKPMSPTSMGVLSLNQVYLKKQGFKVIPKGSKAPKDG